MGAQNFNLAPNSAKLRHMAPFLEENFLTQKRKFSDRLKFRRRELSPPSPCLPRRQWLVQMMAVIFAVELVTAVCCHLTPTTALLHSNWRWNCLWCRKLIRHAATNIQTYTVSQKITTSCNKHTTWDTKSGLVALRVGTLDFRSSGRRFDSRSVAIKWLLPGRVCGQVNQHRRTGQGGREGSCPPLDLGN